MSRFFVIFVFFNQKTAYEMRISDWSSDVCSSDLLTDVGLPGLNGRRLADIARESHPGLKVLFMTGYAENVVDGSEFQGVGLEVILKPFSLDDLMRRIREMLKQPAAGGAALMDAAKLEKLTTSSGKQDADGAGLQ